MPSAWLFDGAYLNTSESKVLFVSSINAHSSPDQSPSMRVGVSASVSSPNASASRLAGSIVTTTARRPCRAPSMASTAAVVVLPTPPDPQHTMIRRVRVNGASVTMLQRSRCCLQRTDGRRQRVAQRVDLRGAQLGTEQIRQSQLREIQAVGQSTELLLLQLMARPSEVG